MVYQYQNFGLTTLDEALDDTETGVDVVSAASFPTEGDFVINIEGELMKVTAVSSNTFTVERGAESTSAVSHPMGATVKNVLTADMVGPPSVRGTYTGDGVDSHGRSITLPFVCSMVFVTGTPTSTYSAQVWAIRGGIDGFRISIDNSTPVAHTNQLRVASDGLSFSLAGVGTNGINENGTTFYYVGIRE